MNKIFAVFLIGLISTLLLIWVPAMASDEPSTETTPSAAKPNASRPAKPSGVIVVHKPRIDPAWGKVIQYHREQIGGFNDKNREILYEFLFQDDQGILRTATFHENASGNGYWEVWVWDQP